MNIRIGKTDVASLGCEGCKKKFVCNIANNSSADKTEVERVLGITVPEMDPPAIIDNSGGEGEKGVLLYLLNQHKSIVSADTDGVLGGGFDDPLLGSPYVFWDYSKIVSFAAQDSKTIGNAEYKTEDISLRNNLITFANRGVDYLYQVSLSPDFQSVVARLDARAQSIYSGHNITVSKNNIIRPDLIEILPPNTGLFVLGDDFGCLKNDGTKYVLRVCDIKTSEFTNSFFFELSYYMLLLKVWLNDTGLNCHFDVAYDAKIVPFDIVNNQVRKDKEWRMDYSLLRDKMREILNNEIPDIINGLMSGNKSLLETVKCSPRCQVCDYYGGQYEGKLYLKYMHADPANGENNYRNFIQDPLNHYCRYFLDAKRDINIIPGIHSCDINYLQNKGLDSLSTLKPALISGTPIQDNSELMSNSTELVKEIDVLGTHTYSEKVDATKSLPVVRPQLRINTFIRQDSQQRMLGCGISYNIYVSNVDATTATGMPINASGALVDNQQVMLVEVDEPDSKSKATTMVSYLIKMKEILEKYKNVTYTDSVGRTQSVSFGIFYWGRKTYEAFKNNLEDILLYMAQNGGSIAPLYAGTRLSARQIRDINQSLILAIDSFADMFSEERITNFERILKNPLFDLQRIYKEVAAVDTNFQYNIMDVYNNIAGTNDHNYYYRPDSDNYSVYIYDKWYSLDRTLQPVEKRAFESRLESADRQHLYYLSILTDKLYDRSTPLGGIVKKGNSPVLGDLQVNAGITIPQFLLLYLFRRLDAAYEQVEIEEAHVSGDIKKQYSGKGILLIRELTNAELSSLSITLRPTQKAYKIPVVAENSNFDENSFGLTVYPQNQFAETFKKFTNDPAYSRYCIYVTSPLPVWTRYTGTAYSDIINCSIAQIDLNRQYIVLNFEQWVIDIIDELTAHYGYDYSKDLYLEASFKDVWSGRLLDTIKSIQKPRSAVKRNLLLAPTLIHDYTYTITDVERVILTALPGRHAVDIKLDDSQKTAISVMYNDNISLLWGPPGTGKSHTLAHYLFLELIEKTQYKILLLGNYTATDNLINALLDTLSDYGVSNAITSKLEIMRMHSSFKNLEPLKYVPGVKIDDWIPQANTQLVLSKQWNIISSTPESFARIAKANIGPKARAIDMFDVVIVDEASQMDVGHFLPGLLKVKTTAGDHTKIIIAGDDKQLQPVQKTKVKEEDTAWFGSIYNYFKNYKNAVGINVFNPVALEISRRSNHCIIDFIRDAFGYNTSFVSDSSIAYDKVSYSVPNYSTSLFEDCLKPEVGMALLVYEDGLSTQRNVFEENQIVDMVLEIWRKGLPSRPDFVKFFSDGVGVVIPHRAQCTAIRKHLISEFKKILPAGSYSDTEIKNTITSAVDTVERFQGQQKDIIIAGYVLGNEDAIDNEEAFIYDSCRLNVVISRARYKAILIASKELMDNISNDLEILDLQKSFQKMKDYCDTVKDITEPGWSNAKIYVKEI